MVDMSVEAGGRLKNDQTADIITTGSQDSCTGYPNLMIVDSRRRGVQYTFVSQFYNKGYARSVRADTLDDGRC